MPFSTFIRFTLPSVMAMILFIAIPLIGVGVLSFRNSYTKTEFVEVQTRTPLGVTVQQRPQSVLDAKGNPVKINEYVGTRYYENLLEIGLVSDAFSLYFKGQSSLSTLYNNITRIPLWGALEFTLLYTLITSPFILLLGFFLALGVHNTVKQLRGTLIFFSLLPFIITPVVGSLAIKWLFIDNAIITVTLQNLGFGKIYFLQNDFTIRFLIILYGIWHVMPFAFIVLYAGLQTVSTDLIESAQIDGANRYNVMRHIIVPHLMPLFVFITLIHVMDAYRVFEPILIFSGGQGANSLQFLTYYFLNNEQNTHKASAAAFITIAGILLLLIPLIYKTFKEQQGRVNT
jgi:multiple sugar transport system permease protein